VRKYRLFAYTLAMTAVSGVMAQDISIVPFEKSGPLPSVLSPFFAKLYGDVKKTGDPDPIFYPYDVDMNGDGRKETFVLVDNPLTCSAHGCQIKVFAPIDGEMKLVFQKVAENIGYQKTSGTQSTGYPTLYTNIPDAVNVLDIKGVYSDHVASQSPPQAWNWNGSSYVAAENK
jgi:hypothetical protein